MSQAYTHGMLQTLHNDRTYGLLTKQVRFDNIKNTHLGCSGYWLVMPEVTQSRPILLNVTAIKKLERLNRIGMTHKQRGAGSKKLL